jgi:hypothetical protein
MLLNAMRAIGRPMLMAMRLSRTVGLRKALHETLRIRHHQRDREENRNSTPPPHFSPG